MRKTSLFLFLLLLVAFGAKAQSYKSFVVTVTGKGQPILLIPGYSCSGDVWEATVQHLQNRYECHVLTLAGFSGVPAIPTPILETVRNEIIAYVKAKKLKRPILMGHSLGAFMSLWVSSTEPALFSKLICVDGVPFVSAMGNPNTSADSLRQNPMYNPETVANNFVAIPDSLFAVGQRRAMLTQVRDTVHANRIAEWSIRSDRRTLGYALVEMSLTDLRPALVRITAPTLVLGSLYGNKETSNRILGEQYRNLSNKEIVVADAKHFIMYDEPQWFYSQIDRFLAAK